jgi:excisionase family DNA binding protein
MPAPRYVLFNEAAAYAGVPVKTLRDWVRKGVVPAWRIGPRLLQVDLNDIDRIRRRVHTSADDPAVAEAAQA